MWEIPLFLTFPGISGCVKNCPNPAYFPYGGRRTVTVVHLLRSPMVGEQTARRATLFPFFGRNRLKRASGSLSLNNAQQ